MTDAGAGGVHATGLTRRFGDLTAVDDVSLDIAEGALFGLLGPDGAGKSTLIRLLATVLTPDAGEATVGGASVTGRPDAVTPQIGYMSQQFCLYPDLTVAENLDFFATVRGVPRAARRERAASLTESMGLAEFTRRQAGRLSGGMKQKLMLASVLMHEPRVLLLDEPTTGVDPVSRREFWRILGDLHAAGTTVLVATPYMDEAERCTDIAFMDAGRIGTRGTPASVKALLPGTLLEIESGRPRDALAVVAGRPEAASAHLLGQAVRVLWTGSDAAASVRALVAPAVPDAVVHEVVPDMEAVFAYLADPDRDAA
jgi:ABC-2 type transport system ATP-binding protein